MTYIVRKAGRNYEVVDRDTHEVVETCKPPEAKKKADACKVKLENGGSDFKADKVKYLDDGTKVNIQYKNKEKSQWA